MNLPTNLVGKINNGSPRPLGASVSSDDFARFSVEGTLFRLLLEALLLQIFGGRFLGASAASVFACHECLHAGRRVGCRVHCRTLCALRVPFADNGARRIGSHAIGVPFETTAVQSPFTSTRGASDLAPGFPA